MVCYSWGLEGDGVGADERYRDGEGDCALLQEAGMVKRRLGGAMEDYEVLDESEIVI